ncbi:MAG: hypothetical protein IJS90_01055 [Clostridia bacterium]|nr:hypothetical protein [Clostridia bacterium]
MQLYDDVYSQIKQLLPVEASVRSPYRSDMCAPEGEKDRILFGSETAYELGGGGRQSASAVLFADIPEKQSETLLFGPDLDEISRDQPFGHVSVVRLKDGSGAQYSSETLKTIGFTVFRLYPEGYHIRISPVSCKEQVRVASSAIKKDRPLSFINVGNSLIREFLKHPEVEYAKTLFITDRDFDYRSLSAAALKVKKITDAVQSAMQLDELDCASCRMKPICDEIDGLRDMHLRKEGKI